MFQWFSLGIYFRTLLTIQSEGEDINRNDSYFSIHFLIQYASMNGHMEGGKALDRLTVVHSGLGIAEWHEFTPDLAVPALHQRTLLGLVVISPCLAFLLKSDGINQMRLSSRLATETEEAVSFLEKCKRC